MRKAYSLFAAVLIIAALQCMSAYAQTEGEASEKKSPVSEFEILHDDDYMVRKADGSIVRIAPKGIFVRFTDRESGDVTTITGKRGVIWISKVKEEGPEKSRMVQHQEIYAEGDVIIIQKYGKTGEESKAMCKQLYFDLHARKGIMLDAWLKVYEPGNQSFFYMTAKKVRQFGTDDPNKTRIKLYNARITNDSFGKPLMYVDAPTVEVERVRRAASEKSLHRPSRITSVTAYNMTAKVRGFPFLYLPFAAGSTLNRYFLRSITTGNSSRYGTYVLTKWDLKRLGLLDNDWDELTLRADYYSKRGPAIGFDYEYSRPDFFGKLSAYYIKDTGKDHFGDEKLEPGTDNRGRIRLQHRHFLGDGWIADLEFSKISDRRFMDEFFERELEEDKDQENLLYLHRTWKHYMITALGKVEVNDFMSSTEYMPQFGFNILSLPILNDRLYFSMDTEVANLRRDYRGHPLYYHDRRTLRADVNTEIAAPFSLGIFRLRPYVGLRGTLYEHTVSDSSEGRLAGYAGLEATTHFSKIYYDSEGRSKLRHIIEPRFKVYSVFMNTVSPQDIVQYDSVDSVNRMTVTQIGLRNTFQTKRGPAGNRRSFDFLMIDAELNIYSNNDSIGYYDDPRIGERIYNGSSLEQKICDNFKSEFRWKVNERFEVFGGAVYNLDNERIDLHQIGFRWYPSDVTSVAFRNFCIRNDGSSTFSSYSNIFNYNSSLESGVFSSNRIGIDSKDNILELDIGYQASDKWSFGIFIQYDAHEGEMEEASFVIRRYFHVWVMDITFEIDDGDDDVGFTVGFSPRAFTSSFVKKRSSRTTHIGSDRK